MSVLLICSRRVRIDCHSVSRVLYYHLAFLVHSCNNNIVRASMPAHKSQSLTKTKHHQ